MGGNLTNQPKRKGWRALLISSLCILLYLRAGNTKGGRITVPLTSVWLVWNQLYDKRQFLFLFAKQTNPNQSNRRSMVQWYFPFSIPCYGHSVKNWTDEVALFQFVKFRFSDEKKFGISFYHFFPKIKITTTVSGNTNWRGRLSTVDLLIKVACLVKVNNVWNIKSS